MGPAFEARRDEAEGTPIGLAAAGHLRALAALLSRVDLEALERVINRLRVARDAGATVFVAGNGGSAATASHWVNDLGKATRCANRPLIRATCLSDNTSWLTALANDEGYERVFAAQLENLAAPRRRAGRHLRQRQLAEPGYRRRAAKELGIDTVGMLGFDGGALRDTVTPAPLAADAGRRVRARGGRPRASATRSPWR